MGKYFLFTMVFIMFIVQSTWNMETRLQREAYQRLDYGLKNAAHDAALFIDQTELADGLIIFDREKSSDVFQESLTRNLPFDENFQSTSPYFKGDMKIIEQINLDHAYIDPDTYEILNFPFIYNYTTMKGSNFNRAILGPSLVFVVEITAIGSDNPTQHMVIQEYISEVPNLE